MDHDFERVFKPFQVGENMILATIINGKAEVPHDEFVKQVANGDLVSTVKFSMSRRVRPVCLCVGRADV